MNAEERINKSQDALVALGVRDVKFYFNNTPESSMSQVVGDAAEVLEEILKGNSKPAEPIGDSYGLKS